MSNEKSSVSSRCCESLIICPLPKEAIRYPRAQDDGPGVIPNQKVIEQDLHRKSTSNITDPTIILKAVGDRSCFLDARPNCLKETWGNVPDGLSLKPPICSEERAVTVT